MNTESQNLVGDRSKILIESRLNVSLAQIAEFCHHWKITEFSLFGSVLRDDFRPDSDIYDLQRIAYPNCNHRTSHSFELALRSIHSL